MSKRLEKWAFVPDTHAPYHDEKAWKLMLKVLRKWKPDGIVHMGDLADFYKVSSHSKDPKRETTFAQEIDVSRALRRDLDRLEPKHKKFIEGNHEDRLTRYIADKCPELVEFVSVDGLLQLKENGWELTKYRDYTNVGKLSLTHDTGQGGKYTAARAAETFQASVAIGHHHAMQYFVTGDARGHRKLGVSFGWLGDADAADYMHRVKARTLWTLGFGLGYLDTRTRAVHVAPIPIVNHRVVVDGRVYEV